MKRTFQNPANGYRETFTAASIVSVLIFGPLYLIVEGVWRHAAVWILVCTGAAEMASSQGWQAAVVAWAIASIILSLFYALGIQDIIRTHYLRSGWLEIKSD